MSEVSGVEAIGAYREAFWLREELNATMGEVADHSSLSPVVAKLISSTNGHLKALSNVPAVADYFGSLKDKLSQTGATELSVAELEAYRLLHIAQQVGGAALSSAQATIGRKYSLDPDTAVALSFRKGRVPAVPQEAEIEPIKPEPGFAGVVRLTAHEGVKPTMDGVFGGVVRALTPKEVEPVGGLTLEPVVAGSAAMDVPVQIQRDELPADADVIKDHTVSTIFGEDTEWPEPKPDVTAIVTTGPVAIWPTEIGGVSDSHAEGDPEEATESTVDGEIGNDGGQAGVDRDPDTNWDDPTYAGVKKDEPPVIEQSRAESKVPPRQLAKSVIVKPTSSNGSKATGTSIATSKQPAKAQPSARSTPDELADDLPAKPAVLSSPPRSWVTTSSADTKPPVLRRMPAQPIAESANGQAHPLSLANADLIAGTLYLLAADLAKVEIPPLDSQILHSLLQSRPTSHGVAQGRRELPNLNYAWSSLSAIIQNPSRLEAFLSSATTDGRLKALVEYFRNLSQDQAAKLSQRLFTRLGISVSFAGTRASVTSAQV